VVENALLVANLAAVLIVGMVALAEWWHVRRLRRVAKLAFGASGKPVAWARLAPVVRVVTMGMLAWGLTILLLEPPQVAEVEPAPEASKHVLVCLDASPSMFLEDAGPQFARQGGPRQRMIRAGEVMQAVLDRLDGEKTRLTVFGVYTKAVPIVEETFDKSVVKNLFDGLPVYSAFEPGPTQLSSSISDAIEYARRWPDNSTLLVIVSDGDSNDTTPIRAVPKAIADTLVIGVGQTGVATNISGHASRQDAESLRTLAGQLRGTYFDANARHLPSELLDRLAIVQPRVAEGVGLRDVAILAVGVGAVGLALLLPALRLGGTPRYQEPLPRAQPAARSNAAPRLPAATASTSSVPASINGRLQGRGV